MHWREETKTEYVLERHEGQQNGEDTISRGGKVRLSEVLETFLQSDREEKLIKKVQGWIEKSVRNE